MLKEAEEVSKDEEVQAKDVGPKKKAKTKIGNKYKKKKSKKATSRTDEDGNEVSCILIYVKLRSQKI